MNPLTDKVTIIPRDREPPLRIIQPGALLHSRNSIYSREAYERYAPFLRLAIDNWPGESKFAIPPGVSPNTFVACLRNARNALMNFAYDPALRERLAVFEKDACFALDPSGRHVWFRAKARRGRAVATPVVERFSAISAAVETAAQAILPVPDEQKLTSLCETIHNKMVYGPFYFSGEVPESLRTSLEDQFDIAFLWEPIKNLTTLR